MDYLWDFPEGTSFREIYKHFTEVKGRDWKRQTLYTYLTILMEQGFLRTEGSRRRTTYIPAISRDAYREFHAKEILEDAYDNSLVKFVTAYAKSDNITKEDADANSHSEGSARVRMNITNYYSCVVHLCMRQLFFWKSLTDTGKGVHLNVSSFSFYIFSVGLRLLLELTEEIFKGIVTVASAVSPVSAVSIASIAVIFIILTRLALSIILSLTVILAVSLIKKSLHSRCHF